MASIFLVNDNKIVSRLLQLSSEKHGYLLEEKTEPEPSREHYDIILVDSDKYSPELVETLKSRATFGKLGYIGVKQEEVPPEFDIHLDKPFLPSDFVTMIEESTRESLATQIAEAPQEHTVISEEVNLEEETLSLDIEETPQDETMPDAEALLEEPLPEEIGEDLDEELEALGELDEIEDLDELDLGDLDLGERGSDETAEAPQPEESTETPQPQEETALKDLDKTEDALKELEALDEEMEHVDLSLDSSAVMSTGVAEQFVEESPEAPAPAPLHEIEAAAQEQKEEQEEEAPSVGDAAALAAGVAAAAAATTVAATTSQEERETEAHGSELDHLEGAEDIEHESDYLEESLSVENLASEFDTLNEHEVMQALDPEAAARMQPQEPHAVEEIVEEEIVSQGEETMVESNDVEKWIRDAVAKAITPEMIQEALQDMEITIKLDFTKKEKEA